MKLPELIREAIAIHVDTNIDFTPYNLYVFVVDMLDNTHITLDGFDLLYDDDAKCYRYDLPYNSWIENQIIIAAQKYGLETENINGQLTFSTK